MAEDNSAAMFSAVHLINAQAQAKFKVLAMNTATIHAALIAAANTTMRHAHKLAKIVVQKIVSILAKKIVKMVALRSALITVKTTAANNNIKVLHAKKIVLITAKMNAVNSSQTHKLLTMQHQHKTANLAHNADADASDAVAVVKVADKADNHKMLANLARMMVVQAKSKMPSLATGIYFENIAAR